MKKIVTTLCLVIRDQKILLGLKKGGFGGGKWNGFGGKVKEGETIEDALKRETLEECGLEISKTEKIGVIDFFWKGKSKIMQVHIFSCNDFSGEPQETKEMKPQWFDLNKLDFNKMWPDDIYWYPLFLAGKKFKGEFLFDKADNVLNYKLEEV